MRFFCTFLKYSCTDLNMEFMTFVMNHDVLMQTLKIQLRMQLIIKQQFAIMLCIINGCKSTSSRIVVPSAKRNASYSNFREPEFWFSSDLCSSIFSFPWRKNLIFPVICVAQALVFHEESKCLLFTWFTVNLCAVFAFLLGFITSLESYFLYIFIILGYIIFQSHSNS